MSDIELKQQIREQLWQANYQAIGRSALSLEQRVQVGESITSNNSVDLTVKVIRDKTTSGARPCWSAP